MNLNMNLKLYNPSLRDIATINNIALKLNDADELDFYQMKGLLKLCDKALIEHSDVFEKSTLQVDGKEITLQNYIEEKILNILNQEKHGYKVGDILIRNCLVNKNPIGYSLVLYDFNRVKEELNLGNVKPKIYPKNTKNTTKSENEIIIHINDEKDLDYEMDDIYLSNALIHNLKETRAKLKYYSIKQDNKEKKYNNKLEELYARFSLIAKKIPTIKREFAKKWLPQDYECQEYVYTSLNTLLETYEIKYTNKFLPNMVNYELESLQNNQTFSIDYNFPLEWDTFDNNKYPNCNLLPIIYTITDKAIEDLQTKASQNNDIDIDTLSNTYKLIKITQEITEQFPEYKKNIQEKQGILPKALSFTFDYEHSFTDSKEYYLNSDEGKEFMKKAGYEPNNNNQDIISNFEDFLTATGKTTEEIDNLYKAEYNKQKEIFDLVHFNQSIVSPKNKIKSKGSNQ